MTKKCITVVFGGTFDPFTAAHKRIVEKLIEKFESEISNADINFDIVIAPSIVNWHRKNKDEFLSYVERVLTIYQMLNKVLTKSGSRCYSVWTNEFDRAVGMKNCPNAEELLKSRGFIDTLQDIIAHKSFCSKPEEAKNNEYYFVIGSDQLKLFKQWKNYKGILSLAKMIVVQGRNGEVVRDYSGDFQYEELFIESEFKDNSATEIRAEWKDKGFDAFYKYITNKYALDDKVYTRLVTPIFNVTSGPEVAPDFAPIKVNAPDWVTILVMKDGKFLIEKQFRYGSNCVIEEFPCGMVEKDEDPLNAAVRELEEETGYKILNKKDVIKMGATSPNPAFMTNTMHYFFVNLDYAKYEVTSQKFDEHEKIEFTWKDAERFMFDLANNAHGESDVVPAIALSAVKLFENLVNYPSGS